MTISKGLFAVGDVVRVPFPFVELPRLRPRPALVIRVVHPIPDHALLWVLMITSAQNRGWQGDVSIADDLAVCGLPVPSIVRTAKVATVDASRATKLGHLPDKPLAAVLTTMNASETA